MRKMTKRRQRKIQARKMRKKANGGQQQGGQQGGFTIDPALIEKHILDKAGEFAGKIQRTVLAGEKMMFSKKTHDQLFGSIDGSHPLGDLLGTAATGMMIILYNESKGTMPGEVIIPAGTILLAKAAKYIDEAKIAPITDDDFMTASEIFTASLKREFEKMSKNSEAQGQQAPQEQAPQAPSGGILQQPSGGLPQQGA